jgi:hypothetical protein
VLVHESAQALLQRFNFVGVIKIHMGGPSTWLGLL